MISIGRWLWSLRSAYDEGGKRLGTRRPLRKGLSVRPGVEMLETRLAPSTTPSNLVISASSGVFPQFQIPDPNGSDSLFAVDTVLSNGNIVASGSGAVYLFNGQTGALISTLTGQISSETALTNGNFVVTGLLTGTVTWVNGTTGLNGAISAANSLIEGGSQYVSTFVTPLTNGNYVVNAPNWNGSEGSVTWCSGTGPTTGTVSAANSLVGTSPNDSVGDSGGSGSVFPLANGNYVVDSPYWNNSEGAVTWGDGTKGVTGTISTANSLTGAGTANGQLTVTPLSNGNYVVANSQWAPTGQEAIGAVTWGDGRVGIVGTMSAENSLIGSENGDTTGSSITALSNGNYVVFSPAWGYSPTMGAVTWANGATGLIGTVSAANSLVGTGGVSLGLGLAKIVALTNGNYVVDDPSWNGNMGAVTWGNGTTGTVGVISAANSLVGSNLYIAGNDGDQVGGGSEGGGGVTALANGNYVVDSPFWEGNNVTWLSGTGAVTLGNGTTGTFGVVSAENSLVGTTNTDMVGFGGVVALTNGNYIVCSFNWNQQKGAVTWGNGTTGIIGTISAANSLIGSTPNVNINMTPPDMVGYNGSLGPNGMVALANGNYLVLSPSWNSGAGATTWGNGTTGTDGVVSGSNSLLNIPNVAGFSQATTLPNGNYLMGTAGGYTWFDGTNGTTLDGQNAPDAQNTLYGGYSSFQPIATGSAFVYGSASSLTVAFTDPNLLTYAFGQGQTISVTPDLITRALDAGTNVTLQANDDIAINSPITETPASGAGSLTLQAGRSIVINSSIDTAGGNLTLIANDSRADGVVDGYRDPGNAAITMASAAALNAGNGALSIDLKNSTDKTNNGSAVVTVLGLTANGSALSSTSTLGISIEGTAPGNGAGSATYTQVNVTGTLDLNGAPLSISHLVPTAAGSMFTIVQTTGGVSGTFQGLIQGATVVATDGAQFEISYQGDGGKDVVLTQLTQVTPPPATISGRVFQDINLNGVQDPGEPGVPGQTLFLDLSGSGMFEPGDPTAKTDASGNYQFTISNAGNYTVRLQPLGGWLLGTPASGSYEVTVSGGVNVAGQNFAEVPTSIVVPLSLPLNDPFPKQGNANADYVEALYRAFLQRDAEPGGLGYWTGLLNSLAMSRLQLVQAIWGSIEHRTQEATQFYFTLLGRAPDSSGLQYWVQALGNGLTEEQVAYDFLNSPEYLSKGDKYFVDHMYLSLLGRTFDPVGERNWLNALGDDSSGNVIRPPILTHQQVITDFLYSPESLNRLVQGFYQVILQRLADPQGLADWLTVLHGGAAFATIGQQFYSSDEFYNDAAANG